MPLDTIVLFSLVSFFYIISPGPAVFLALSNGMGAKNSAIVYSSLGNIIGLFLLSSISMAGLGSLIIASAKLFFLVKLIGAAYLLYLGFKQFQAAISYSKLLSAANINKQKPRRAFFMEGFLLAVSNPKPILFFIAIFPQFLSSKHALFPQFIIMTSTFMLISFCVLITYGYLAKTVKQLFSSPVKMKWFHCITGGFFVGMGANLWQLKQA